MFIKTKVAAFTGDSNETVLFEIQIRSLGAGQEKNSILDLFGVLNLFLDILFSYFFF